jgi:hypothetical protein
MAKTYGGVGESVLESQLNWNPIELVLDVRICLMLQEQFDEGISSIKCGPV